MLPYARWSLAHEGKAISEGDPWLPRLATLKFQAEIAEDGTNEAPAKDVVLSFDVSTGDPRLYKYFPFHVWIYLDERPAAFLTFTEGNQARRIQIQAAKGIQHDIKIVSELSGCPAYLGINEDQRDLAVYVYNFECIPGGLDEDLAEAARLDIREWQTDAVRTRPNRHIPKGAVTLNEDAFRTGGTWLPVQQAFAIDPNDRFNATFDLEACGLAAEVADYTPTDILIQVNAFKEIFAADETVTLTFRAAGITQPAMTLVLDRQQTVSACFVSLGLASKGVLEIEVEVSGLNLDLLKRRGAYGFRIAAFVVNRPILMKSLEERTVWLFSVARSGTTWLGEICWALDEIAVIDEPCLPRMLGISKVDPELFHPSNPALWSSGPMQVNIQPDRSENDEDIIVDYQTPPAVQRQIVREARTRNNIWAPHSRGLMASMFVEASLEQCLREYGLGWYRSIFLKCPNDGQIADFIPLWMPLSKMVMLVRDGRDVMRSRFSAFASQTLHESSDEELRRYCIAWYAQMWSAQQDISSVAQDLHPADRVLSVRYEDIRVNSLTFLKTLAAFLEAPLSDEKALAISQSTKLENAPPESRGSDKARQDGCIGGYKSRFSADEVQLMNDIMGRNLRRFGYEVEDEKPESPTQPSGPSKEEIPVATGNVTDTDSSQLDLRTEE